MYVHQYMYIYIILFNLGFIVSIVFVFENINNNLRQFHLPIEYHISAHPYNEGTRELNLL